MPRRGLADLVSKFEMLDKANDSHRRNPSVSRQPIGLTASKTMSSLAALQNNRRHHENSPLKRDGSSDLPLTLSSVAAAPRRTDTLPMKPVATLSNETTHKGRLSATIAEKRRLFEAEVPFLKELSGSRMPNTKSPKTATAMFLQEENSDKKLSSSHSCTTMYTVPKTEPNFGVCSLQHSHSQRHDKTQNPSIYSVPASSFVLRVHREADAHNSMRDKESRRFPRVDVSRQSPLRASQVSSTGSPMKSPCKPEMKTVGTGSRDTSPFSSPRKSMARPPSSGPPLASPVEMKRHSASSITPNASVESVNSIIIAKRGRSVPQLAKNWSPQRIVTPQKPTMPQNASPVEQAEGHGTFVKPKKSNIFRDALGFFESMSHKRPSHPVAAREAIKGSSDEIRSITKPHSKREKVKGSLRQLSSSWRFKRASAVGEQEALLEYPAMWKLGSIEAAPRKRLHAEWCDVSADHRRPLGTFKAGEISLLDPYLSSHAKSRRGEEDSHHHIDILLQQSSLHGNFCGTTESDYSEINGEPDCSPSPVQESPEPSKPRSRSSRRWFSRSSGALVSQAHCRLEQPRPVHGMEMKRLMSLCKIQGTVKRRGHSE
ncbi:uncharacterized protein BBA_04484 [Beauveria bassiana ARSEF 2860]|uniref:Uncharacterized protein n=1 Tax=Beauveria bassiana (strain ARSEF 2860) TaxID=655819 RepID=J4KNZ1_BEAB2|nr:uncharacterized protein BBA_04484 [Beauveria bassiana ARSEF 2860]EJP66544.1 hypothetical protein BBA_04484 [Beauveria bassiana ARSEF 2860]